MTEHKAKFKFGAKVRETITGFSGTVTGFTTYITGCTQYLVQPAMKESGDFQEPRWWDEDRLEVTAADPINLQPKKNGADLPAPIR